MEEIEVPTERLHEDLHHAAEHAAGQAWISRLALGSALLAVLAAVTALLAGQHANEAMVEQIQASNHWSYYQAKSIKGALLEVKTELSAHGASEKDRTKIEQYEKDREQISEQAREEEASSKAHFLRHEIFARGVTFFQVAIGISAIAALTRRKRFAWVSLAFGLVGLAFLAQGLLKG